MQYGANVEDFYLDSAPAGVVSGTITETGTGTPLEAAVKVYRSDNGSLYTETTSDPVTGYYEVTLPYFNYSMNVRAYHHIPQNRGISVSTPAMTEDFVLDEAAPLFEFRDRLAHRWRRDTMKDGLQLAAEVARSMSASSSTIRLSLPPSSMQAFFRCAPHFAAMRRPTAAEPVKATASRRSRRPRPEPPNN